MAMKCFGWMLVMGLAMNTFFSSAAMAQLHEELDADREPAAVSSSLRRTYPGGGDEEDLRVMPSLPEAPLKTDQRSLQKEVYKALYKQELKDDHQDTMEE